MSESDISGSHGDTEGGRSLRVRQPVNYKEDIVKTKTIGLDDRPAKRQRVHASEPLAATREQLREAAYLEDRDLQLEAETAWALGFNALALTEEEENLLPSTADESCYTQMRNLVLARWRRDVTRHLSEQDAGSGIPPSLLPYLSVAWRFLNASGYINFGITPELARPHSRKSKGRIIVVGAGLAGLAAARRLQMDGFQVLVLEGHDRAGGRVYTKLMQAHGRAATADLGASVITGIDGNPLAVLAKQLQIPLHDINTANVPLYLAGGEEAAAELDAEVEQRYNHLLDTCSKQRDNMGEVTDQISLGTALETLWKLQDRERQVEDKRQRAAGIKREESDHDGSLPLDVVDPGTMLERQLLDWHIANLEFANAATIEQLSMRSWDQDDPHELEGAHCFLPGGNGRLIAGLCEDLPVRYNSVVSSIRCCSAGVLVTSGSRQFSADAVIVAVPLGVLKKGSIEFSPALPERKQEAIQRLGFGLLNKIALLFPQNFWGDSDMFGHVASSTPTRGEYFLFYSYAAFSGGPLLIALVSGAAAYKFEQLNAAEATARVMKVLRSIFGPRGVDVPSPLQACCTRWSQDPMAYGSYSSVAVGSLGGEDYDIMAESIGSRVFFAGEATTRKYPATMHGAFISGVREAGNVAACLARRASEAQQKSIKAEATSGVSKIEEDDAKQASFENAKSSAELAEQLTKVFDDMDWIPEAEFGCCCALQGPAGSGFRTDALVRVDIGGVPGSRLRSRPIFCVLSWAEVLRLRDCPGDEARISHLATNTAVKLVGRTQTGRLVREMLQAILSYRANAKLAAASHVPTKPEDCKDRSLHPEMSQWSLSNKASKACPAASLVWSLLIAGARCQLGKYLYSMAKSRPRKRKAQVVLEGSDLDDDPGASQKPSLNLLEPGRSPHGKRAQQLSLKRFTQAVSPAADPISANTPKQRASNRTLPGFDRLTIDAETWTDKHAPQLQQDLVVHNKKIAEVHGWMAAAADQHGPPCAVICGPCGCGKGTTIRAVAQSLRLSVVDWRPSAPTLWAESSYQVLESHIFPSLKRCKSLQAEPRWLGFSYMPRLRLILIDDLPQAHDASHRAALLQTICEMVRTARGPLAIVLREATGGTSSSHSGSSQASFSFHKELVDALKAAGAQQINFNPFTEAVLARRLLAVAETEGIPLAKAQAESLAVRAAGDLSAAINSLQLGTRSQSRTLRPQANGSKAGKKGKVGNKRTKAAAQSSAPGFEDWLDHSGSDPSLTMMHALGKFLYNKRLPPGSKPSQPCQATEHGSFAKPDAMCLTQPSASQPCPSQPPAQACPSEHKPDGGNQRHHHAAGSQPSQQSCESSKLDHQADRNGPPLSSWPGNDGVFTDADDLIDLTVEEALSQQQQQQPSGHGASQPDPVDVAQLPMAARHMRDPIAFQPEPVLMQSGLEASAVSSFLHENMLHFIDDPGIEDAANALEYLSIADCLLRHNSTLGSSSTPWEEPSFAASSLKDALAGSVAVRGWLYSNAHPGPRRFQAMRGPQAQLVQKAAAANCSEVNAVYCRLVDQPGKASGSLANHASVSYSSLFGSWRIFAGEILPYVRAIGDQSTQHAACTLLPHSWSRIWDGRISCQTRIVSPVDAAMQPRDDVEVLEDDIEDWEI
ncbi:hypothetical protein WJX74_008996 [Apatococcus lobatus]|uniref:SWIRM domain-containing protein n=1 Tax=Apatococcus lobatus TaxID=904363 RepID=A0AAW1SF98_9CHLO